MHGRWKEGIQFIRDLEYLRSVMEEHVGCEEYVDLTWCVQDYVEKDLEDYLDILLSQYKLKDTP